MALALGVAQLISPELELRNEPSSSRNGFAVVA
jgi:hypothetical protein